MLSHVRQERTWWTEARNLRDEMTLRILAKYKRHGITAKHLGLRKRQLWAPMVPVDRAQLVEEVVSLLQAHGISLELAVELLGHAPDIQEEIKKIVGDMQVRAKLKKAEQPDPPPVAKAAAPTGKEDGDATA